MKTALIVASVLTVSGIIIAAVGLAIMGFDFTKLSTAKTVTRTFEIDEGFDSITVGTSTCDVRLLPSEDGKCKIVCTDRDKITYDVGVENNTLAIEEKDGRKWYDYISIFNYKTEITLYLPETCLKSLSATGDTGNVTVPKDFLFENIDVKVSTGKRSIMSATSGSLSLKTSTGINIASAITAVIILFNMLKGPLHYGYFLSRPPKRLFLL